MDATKFNRVAAVLAETNIKDLGTIHNYMHLGVDSFNVENDFEFPDFSDFTKYADTKVKLELKKTIENQVEEINQNAFSAAARIKKHIYLTSNALPSNQTLFQDADKISPYEALEKNVQNDSVSLSFLVREPRGVKSIEPHAPVISTEKKEKYDELLLLKDIKATIEYRVEDPKLSAKIYNAMCESYYNCIR